MVEPLRTRALDPSSIEPQYCRAIYEEIGNRLGLVLARDASPVPLRCENWQIGLQRWTASRLQLFQTVASAIEDQVPLHRFGEAGKPEVGTP